MEKFTLKSLCVVAFSVVLLGCENENDAVSPLAVNDTSNFGTSPDACEVIEFDGYNDIETGAGSVTTVYSEGTPVRVSAQLKADRGAYFNTERGTYSNTNAAILYNTSQPDERNKNFRTPNNAAIRPMGNVLTAGKVQGNATAIYNKGSRLEMDFSAMGSITLNAIHVLDITQDEADSELELIDKNGNVIKAYKLPVTGAYGATRLNTENTTGVEKIRVTFTGSRKNSGSGAIDVIEFCRD
ncbi:hypothetical protein [uncultured Pontibacter sp.]|uniref:hypothetical protein n=1 Tax=uncultured Pontibacter sp. TaxID=453356 RepID=UPI002638D0EA|nr:hypothetical protein [uncultured Pontibacter sp.]